MKIQIPPGASYDNYYEQTSGTPTLTLTASECRQYGLDNSFTNDQLHCGLSSSDSTTWNTNLNDYPAGCFIYDKCATSSDDSCYGMKAIRYNNNLQSSADCGTVVGEPTPVQRNSLQKGYTC